MDTTFIENILFDPTVGKIVTALIGILIIQIVTSFIARNVDRRIQDLTVRYRVRKIIEFTRYLVIILFISLVFSNRLGNLTVAFGVAGAGIAFALQEVIASAAGWFAISFADFYKIGDRVELGGIKGDVIDIGILRTTLMELGEWVHADLYNGRIVRVANSFVFKSPVYNYSGDFPFLWDEITIPVKYGSDYRLARRILEDVAREVVGPYSEQARETWHRMLRKYLVEEASVEPMITLIANDNWVEYSMRYVVDYKKRRSTKDRIFSRILEDFDQTGSRVSFASSTIELVNMPEFNVNMAGRHSEE